jgi:hypothetical protein
VSGGQMSNCQVFSIGIYNQTTTRVPFFPFCCRFDVQLCECETSQPVRILVLFYSKAFLAYLGDVQSPQEPLIGDPIISKNPKFVFFPFSFLFLRD